ncbi:MAG: metal-sensing transcriptional repressor [Patescibacteria group bacterium]|nr:metal-sensing transcriptional repressor [Patescibacteria group bacterium]
MTDNKKAVLIGLKKAQSHLNKVIAMVEDGHYCIDVMQQNLAVIGLLRSAHQTLMENHLHSCFLSAMKTNNQAKKSKMVEEILSVTKLYNK